MRPLNLVVLSGFADELEKIASFQSAEKMAAAPWQAIKQVVGRGVSRVGSAIGARSAGAIGQAADAAAIRGGQMAAGAGQAIKADAAAVKAAREAAVAAKAQKAQAATALKAEKQRFAQNAGSMSPEQRQAVRAGMKPQAAAPAAPAAPAAAPAAPAAPVASAAPAPAAPAPAAPPPAPTTNPAGLTRQAKIGLGVTGGALALGGAYGMGARKAKPTASPMAPMQ